MIEQDSAETLDSRIIDFMKLGNVQVVEHLTYRGVHNVTFIARELGEKTQAVSNALERLVRDGELTVLHPWFRGHDGESMYSLSRRKRGK